MGGATVAVVNDRNRSITKPCWPWKIKGLLFTLADPEIEVEMKTSRLWGESIRNGGPQINKQRFKDNPGKSIHTRG